MVRSTRPGRRSPDGGSRMRRRGGGRGGDHGGGARDRGRAGVRTPAPSRLISTPRSWHRRVRLAPPIMAIRLAIRKKKTINKRTFTCFGVFSPAEVFSGRLTFYSGPKLFGLGRVGLDGEPGASG